MLMIARSIRSPTRSHLMGHNRSVPVYTYSTDTGTPFSIILILISLLMNLPLIYLAFGSEPILNLSPILMIIIHSFFSTY